VAEPGRHILTSFLAATMFVGLFERLGGYRLKQLSRLDWQLKRVLITWGFTVAVLLLIAFFSKTSEIYSRGWVLAWMITAPVLLLIGRGVLQVVRATGVGGTCLARNIAIVGAGDEGRRPIARLWADQDRSIVIRGVYDDRKSRLPSTVCGLAVRGTADDLLDRARHESTNEVVIALPLHAEGRLKSFFEKMKALAVDVRLSLEPFVETFRVRGMGYIGDVPLLEIIDRPLKSWNGVIKFSEDKLLGLFLLALVSPLMALIAILIKLDSRGALFFRQKRFGFNNQVIHVLKFRTMHIDRSDPSGEQRTVRNDPRVTRHWKNFALAEPRRTASADQCGPRRYVAGRSAAPCDRMKTGDRLYYEAVEQLCTAIASSRASPAGAQVNGLRGEVDTLEKARARVAHDLYYIEHCSLWLDLKILLKTAGVLVSRENAY
jgi:lipopolysaccharide/colanic/teichoic acid biosynthesis glycosyltransferase